MPRIPIGIQLYTVREDLDKDVPGTLKELAEIGYEGIELAGSVKMPLAEFRNLVEDLGLRIAGAHAPLDDLKNELERVLEDQEILGNRRIVLPSLPEEMRSAGSQAYREVGEFLGEISEKVAPMGFSISYHNHSFEFVTDGDGYFLDTLLEAGEKGHVKSELDTYWVKHGGADPVHYIRKYSGRIDLLHIKDMGPGHDQPFAEVGFGILDWEGIFMAAEETGVQWYLVEQDLCPGPPLESARKSLGFLRERGMLG